MLLIKNHDNTVNIKLYTENLTCWHMQELKLVKGLYDEHCKT